MDRAVIEEIIGKEGIYGTNDRNRKGNRIMDKDYQKVSKKAVLLLMLIIFKQREATFDWTYINGIVEIKNTYDLIAEKITDILGSDKIIYTEQEDILMWQYDYYNIITLRMEPYMEPGDTSNVVSKQQITIRHQCTDIG